MSIIGFLAKQRHGKDTAADYLVKHHGYKKISFADDLKGALAILFKFSHEQLYGDKKEIIDQFWKQSPREIMRWFGTDVFRQRLKEVIPWIDDRFWAIKIKQICEIKFKKNPQARLVIADVRFQNEIDVIKGMSGRIIKIYRPEVENKTDHVSEVGIDKIKKFDVLIVNDGTKKDLYKKVEKTLFGLKLLDGTI